MTDTKPLESQMDSQPYTASYHAATLRRTLWMEHLGLLPPQPLDNSSDPNSQPPGVSPNRLPDESSEDWELVADPLGDKVWDLWTRQATVNTEVFRKVFHADPDDSIRNFDDYKNFLPPGEHKQGHLFDMNMSIKEVKQELDKIRGHLVWMPLRFLEEAEMAEKGLQVNAYTESIYT
jgi:phospholipase D1/2